MKEIQIQYIIIEYILNKIASVLLVAAFAITELIEGVQGRKFKDEQKNIALKNTRRVQQFYGYGSSRQIYWNFDKHFWRLDMRPPVLEVGYEFEQSQPIIKSWDALS